VNKKNYYIDKKEFHELLKEYQSTKSKILYEKIGKNLILLVTGLVHNPSFLNWDGNTKDSMISDALYRMTRKINDYDAEKYDNPFGYFNMIAYRCFQRNINLAKIKAAKFINVDFIENINNSYDIDEEGDFVIYNKCSKENALDVSFDHIDEEIRKLNTLIERGES
jgi:hypothetical protein